jgi:hemolysin III
LIHIGGIAFALAGGIVLVVAAWPNGFGRAVAVTVYALSLLTMFTASAASNLARSSDPRRRLENGDEAAIFVMIAGSYTPFTTQVLQGALAIGMTLSIWCFAVAAAAGKLFLTRVSRRIWMLAYLVLGWFVIIATEPLVTALPPLALTLLVGGGVVYTVGTIFYAAARLPFRRAIWHGFVLAGAAMHFAAILTGIVLR